jgi:hypothetical protein
MADSKLISESRDVEGFSQIDLRDFGRLVITQGPEESLTIEADADLMPKIRSEVKGEKLVLGIGRDWMERVFSGYDFIKQRTVIYTLSVKRLEAVQLSGKHEVLINELDAAKLHLHSSGASDIEMTGFTGKTLEVDASGRSKIVCSGRVEMQSIRVSGSCEYQGADLQSQKSSVKISGRSTVELWAEQSLDVSISGMGTVLYRGAPAISQSISGVGEVKQLASKPENSK